MGSGFNIIFVARGLGLGGQGGLGGLEYSLARRPTQKNWE